MLAAALIDTLKDDQSLSIIHEAVVNAAHLFEKGWEDTTVTIIAPTNQAFHSALAQQRLLDDNLKPYTSIQEYFSLDNGQQNILRHIFLWGGTIDEMVTKRNLTSVNGFSVQTCSLPAIRTVTCSTQLPKTSSTQQSKGARVMIVDQILPAHTSTGNLNAQRRCRTMSELELLSRETNKINGNLDEIRCMSLPKGEMQIPFMFKAVNAAYCNPTSTKQSSNSPLSPPNSITQSSFVNAFNGKDILWKIPENVQRPDNDEDLAFMSITEIASLLRQGTVTSVELTQLCLSRLKDADEYLELLVTDTEDLAVAQAKQADAEMSVGTYRSPLHGIPYGLKDLIAVPGYPTTWGSKHCKDQMFDEGAWVYECLRKAGAVLVAKLSTGQLAYGDIWFGGRTRNPWNITEGSSGSSAGSGAAVVAGLVPFAIGTETWGSITSPAARTGACAIRPTFGSIGRTGTMCLAWSLDKIGCFCRTALDGAMVFDCLRGIDPDDVSSVKAPLADPQRMISTSIRIGYISETDDQVVKYFEQMGMQMILVEFDVRLPLSAIMNVVISAEIAAALSDWLQSVNEPLDQHLIPLTAECGRSISTLDYLAANRARQMVIEEFEERMGNLDALLFPTEQVNLGILGNLVGAPELVFPVRFLDLKNNKTSARKDPLTQALLGRPFSEGLLTAIVAKYQEKTNHHQQRPPVQHVEQDALLFKLPHSRRF